LPRLDYRYCKKCGRSREEVGSLSRTRLCSECWGDNLAENMVGISAKIGPAYERQQVGTIAAALGITDVMAHRLMLAANGLPVDVAAPLP
jgi:hypothetical protein